MIFLSRPFRRNFRTEGATIFYYGFYFPPIYISDITFKISAKTYNTLFSFLRYLL